MLLKMLGGTHMTRTVDSLWRLRQHLSDSSISQRARCETAISQNEAWCRLRY